MLYVWLCSCFLLKTCGLYHFVQPAPPIYNKTDNLPVQFCNNNIFVSSGVCLGIYPNDTASPGAERKGTCTGVCICLYVLSPYNVVSHQHRDRDQKPIRMPSHIFRDLLLLLVNTGGRGLTCS